MRVRFQADERWTFDWTTLHRIRAEGQLPTVVDGASQPLPSIYLSSMEAVPAEDEMFKASLIIETHSAGMQKDIGVS